MTDPPPARVASTEESRAAWWRDAVVYQIYPRSFADSNGDGIGDLPGITSRVPYLASLGIDAVWLSPFYPSALADGGYDVDDYRDVDARLGTLHDFDELVAAFHRVNVRVMVDIVPNHSSNRHQWFRDALASPPGSPERARYVFRDGRGEAGELPPSDWPSHFGTSAWTRTQDLEGTPGQWYLHLFSPEQPDFNWDNREVQLDFLTTLRFWADRGVDGFRVDVAHALKKDLSEPLRSKPAFVDFDNPLSGDDVLFDRNEVHSVYREWRTLFDEYDPPRFAVAEAWVRPERRVLYARADGLGQAFNFDLLRADWDAEAFRSVIDQNLEMARESGSSSTWVLSNHDVVRHATRFGLPKGTDLHSWLLTNGVAPAFDRSVGLRCARAATMLVLALPGSTYIYQGEELGLAEVADIPADEIQDPIWERTAHTAKGRDGSRVPLPWDPHLPSFGFGTGGAHLTQPGWFADLSVSAQSTVQGSTLEMYRDAIAHRTRLHTSDELRWMSGSPAGVLDFERPNGWRSITNFGTEPYRLPGLEVVLSSGPLSGQLLPPDTTVWMT